MITDKDLIRRALLGDQEAQAQCTEKGIMLPCPWCNCKTSDLKRSQSIEWYWRKCRFCGAESSVQGTKSKANLSWNTRPAPPIGRCGECKYYTVLWHCEVHSQEPDQYDSGVYVEMLPDDFCSYFEPKEEK